MYYKHAHQYSQKKMSSQIHVANQFAMANKTEVTELETTGVATYFL